MMHYQTLNPRTAACDVSYRYHNRLHGTGDGKSRSSYGLTTTAYGPDFYNKP
jgi:hypothetical protein